MAGPSKAAQEIQAQMEREAGILRARATALHEASDARLERFMAEKGAERDEAAAESHALKEKAKAADIQAQREHRGAASQEKEAADLDAKAEAETDPVMAQEHREDAATLRAYAKGDTERAQAAEQRSKAALEEAAVLDAQVAEYEAGDLFGPQPQIMGSVADTIDVKVRFLEESLALQKEAYALQDAGDPRAREVAERAMEVKARADAIEPAYDDLDADALATAGLGGAVNPDDIEMDSPPDPNIEMEPMDVSPTAPADPDAVDPNIEMDPLGIDTVVPPSEKAPADGGEGGVAPADPDTPAPEGGQLDGGNDPAPSDATDGDPAPAPEPAPEIPAAWEPPEYEPDPAPPIDEQPADDLPPEGADEMSDM